MAPPPEFGQLPKLPEHMRVKLEPRPKSPPPAPEDYLYSVVAIQALEKKIADSTTRHGVPPISHVRPVPHDPPPFV